MKHATLGGRITFRRESTWLAAWWRGNRVGYLRERDGRWEAAFHEDDLTDPNSWHAFDTREEANGYLADFEIAR